MSGRCTAVRARLCAPAERQVAAGHTHLCVSLCTQQVHVSRGGAALHLSVCLSVSQANTRISAFHQSLRPSEIHHKVEEVKVGGRSRCSAARGSGLTVGHMTTSQFCCHPRGCTGVDGALVVSRRCHLSTPESFTSWITFLHAQVPAHLQAPPTWFLHSGHGDIPVFLNTLQYISVKWCMNIQHTRQEVTWKFKSHDVTLCSDFCKKC